jgi:hypothetical protein
VHDKGRESLFLELEAEQVVALPLEQLVMFEKIDSQSPQRQRALYADHEFGGTNGLREKVVAAGAKRAIEGLDVARRCEKEDGNRGAMGQGPDSLAHGEAVEAGHPNIEEDAIGSLRLERGDSFGAARSQDNTVAFILERVCANKRLASLSSTTRILAASAPESNIGPRRASRAPSLYRLTAGM